MRIFKLFLMFFIIFISFSIISNIKADAAQYKTILEVDYNNDSALLLHTLQKSIKETFGEVLSIDVSDELARDLALRMVSEIGNVGIPENGDRRFTEIQIESIMRYHVIKFFAESPKKDW